VDDENNPGPPVFNKTNPTISVCWPQVKELTEAQFGENVGKQCVANYVHLIMIKIYNQIEDTVPRICLLD